MKKSLFIVSVFIFTSISLFYLNATDIKTALADERLYGPSILDDIIIAIKFEGTPSSILGIHQFKEIQEDAIKSNLAGVFNWRLDENGVNNRNWYGATQLYGDLNNSKGRL